MNNNIDSIIKYFANYDSAGKSSSKIDSILEYKELGNYLNGQNSEHLTGYNELSDTEKNKLNELYNNLKNKFANFFSNKDEKLAITVDNVKKYETQLSGLEQKENKTEDDNFAIKKYRQAILDFAKQSGYINATEDIDVDSMCHSYIIRETLSYIEKKNSKQKNAKQSLRLIEKPYDNKKLEHAVKKYVKNNAQAELNNEAGVDLGNGKFDKPTKQKTNVCWALAGINTLLQSETGKKLLEDNKYFDAKSGNFAIHLQEAEDNGLHDGVYIITPQEIFEENKNSAEGDGDTVAYLVAIKKYFNEVGQDASLNEKLNEVRKNTGSLDDGNYGHRFFELITGGSYSELVSFERDKPLEKGISTGTPYSVGYKKIYETIKNGSGAINIVCAEHSISVVGVNDGKLIVQESNNSKDFSTDFSDSSNGHVIFNKVADINNAPAYEINEEDFNGYIQSVSLIKWQ